MGYFDSPKNQALWAIELQNLKRLREERKAGKSVVIERKIEQSGSWPQPIDMTYEDLLKEVAEKARKKQTKERQALLEAAKVKMQEAYTKEIPKKEAGVYEKK